MWIQLEGIRNWKAGLLQESSIRRKKYEIVIEGDADKTAHTKAMMQKYCKDRELLWNWVMQFEKLEFKLV